MKSPGVSNEKGGKHKIKIPINQPMHFFFTKKDDVAVAFQTKLANQAH